MTSDGDTTMADGPNEFQTVVDETLEAQVQAKERERIEIEAFIGRYIIDWGYTEFFMSMAIQAWARGGVARLQQAMLTQQAVNKINFLEGLLPPNWRAGAALIRELREANQYRNALAHSNVAMGGFDGERQLDWHLWNVRGRAVRLDLTRDEQVSRTAKVQVVRAAAAALLSDHLLNSELDLNDISLASLVANQPGTWRTRSEWDAFRRTAYEILGN